MKSALLFILVTILVSVVLSKIARHFLTKLESKKMSEILEKEKQEQLLNKDKVEHNKIVFRTEKNDFKEVLNKQNSSASRKPQDFNDKQNLDPKFSPNVYRGKNGRFKSKKEWNKEQKLS